MSYSFTNTLPEQSLVSSRRRLVKTDLSGRSRQAKTDPPSKNRVWNFSTFSSTRVTHFSSKTPETTSETTLTTTKTVSGLPFWPSRDPIVILKPGRTKQNYIRIQMRNQFLYVFLRNKPVDLIDRLGQMATKPPPNKMTPCEEAKKILGSQSASGNLVCHNGKLIGCIWNTDDKAYKDFPEILKCAQEHEDLHVKQHSDLKCRPCETYKPTFPKKEADEDECAAYTAQLECLIAGFEKDCGGEYDPDKDYNDGTDCEFVYDIKIYSVNLNIKIHCK